MAHVALTAQKRTEFGNGPTRRLRRGGHVPGVVYQPGSPSLAFSLPERELRRAIAEGRTGVIDLSVEGEGTRPVLLKDWQLDPVRGDVLHVDFQEVDLTQEVEAPVQIVLVGSSVGVRDGGVLDQTQRELVVRALPEALPDHLDLDVSELAVGDSITVEGIAAPQGVVIVTDPETVVASVIAPTVEPEEEPEELEEGEEGEAAEEGEAPGEESEGSDSEE
ncbi:MAG TPA: 50S ribosomal protein L25 [Miltoncostaeaceae bacterium]|jgi:large subunit ribosomal protein L25|nr:50S ribosomal protein L25 [Miltoncostaeaceae bacterium]